MVRRSVGRGRGNNCRKGHRAFALKNVECARDVGIFLTNRDIDAIKRTIIFLAGFLGGFVQARLTDDRVDRDRRFAGRAIANDQLALTAADRNHRVDRHDASLDRLAHAFTFDDAGRDFFERVKCFALDRSLVVERLAERINYATEQSFADRNGQQSPGGLRFIPFTDFGWIAE